MLALFKSHYSIGKSILTLNHPDKQKDGGPQSVFSICDSSDEIILVEDSLVGFLQAQKTAESLNKKIIFGLRVSCSHEDFSKESKDCVHKIIIFAKTDSGCKLLNKIYSEAFCNNEGVVNLPKLKSDWNEDHLMMAVPFYDSFVFMNNFHFCNCIPDFSFAQPTFLIEENDLPFDQDLKQKVLDYCSKNSYDHELSKSIYYKNRSDFEAYQTYKCICSKKFKQRTLHVPNFDHLASPEFCYESYLEKCDT
jgi:DNA polymerase III alpha subunit